MTECGCSEICRLNGWTDQFQPATRELMVFTKNPKRYFDVDAVRQPLADSPGNRYTRKSSNWEQGTGQGGRGDKPIPPNQYSAGAPPLDWWQIPSPKPQPVTEGDPMTATFYVGDAIETMNKLPEKSVDLILTSPPFLALRSYLPADHPDKALEGGSQATPGEYIDWLIDVVEACDRVLAPHGSMAIELGDTYSGSGGAGGDYAENGLREGQPTFRQGKGNWPLPKSLSLIPELFRLTLVYGTNPLTGRTTERWRLRNVVRWVRPNPPVGALGDKFRPATSELMVFCKSAKRYFDLDAVREPIAQSTLSRGEGSPRIAGKLVNSPTRTHGNAWDEQRSNPAGAPPLDWWNIPLLEGEEPTKGGPKPPKDRLHEVRKVPAKQADGDFQAGNRGGYKQQGDLTMRNPNGAPPLDWWNIPPGGYVTWPERVNPGEYVDGTLYIASAGCPLHAGLSVPAATAPHGEPTSTPSSHSSDTDANPALRRQAGSVPTDQPSAPTLWGGSSDSPNPESTPAAKRRSKASNRTAPAPATSPLDTASDRTPDRTDDTSSEPLSDVPHPDSPENRTSALRQAFLALESYARTGHKPAELEGCSCSFAVYPDSTSHYAVKPAKRDRSQERWAGQVPHDKATGRDGGTGAQNPGGAPPLDWWEIAPGGFSGAHYAVFPPELCIKPIKAMCPERVCRQCGEPSRRIVGDPEYVRGPNWRGEGRNKPSHAGDLTVNEDGDNAKNASWQIHASVIRTAPTLGFSDCGHDDWRPGLVLDPFGGSGTTALVATGHSRDCILIDLDERNYELALQRVGPFILERAG